MPKSEREKSLWYVHSEVCRYVVKERCVILLPVNSHYIMTYIIYCMYTYQMCQNQTEGTRYPEKMPVLQTCCMYSYTPHKVLCEVQLLIALKMQHTIRYSLKMQHIIWHSQINMYSCVVGLYQFDWPLNVMQLNFAKGGFLLPWGNRFALIFAQI